MYEHIFLSVIPVDKAISALYVEPLDRTRNFFGYQFLLNRSGLFFR